MRQITFVILLLVMATLFSTVHAQEVTSDATSSSAENEATPSETNSSDASETTNSTEKINENETVDEKQNESKINSINDSAVDAVEIVPAESGRKHRTPKIVSTGNNDPCTVPGGCEPVIPAPGTIAPCVVSDTIGCPIDPCLAADTVFCQPRPEPPIQPEENSPEEEFTPLFSFNPLWVVGPVKPSNPSAGTLVTNPIPIELTETGPNPLIIGQADGRSVPEEVFAPAPAATTASLTGLFTGANLPWLGLLVLLVFGIFAWRGRKQ